MNKTTQILAVNDAERFLDLLELCMQQASIPLSFDKAYNGEEAVNKIKEGNTYEAILMNLDMPIMSGITAARILRNLGTTIPIIPWSAHARYRFEEECKEAGMNDYIEIGGVDIIQDILKTLERVGVKVAT